MRPFRFLVLVLLMALLPLRGSFAAALLCHEMAPGAHTELRGELHEHDEVASAHHAHHEARSARDGGHGHAADKCNLCSGLSTPACPLQEFAAVPAGVGASRVTPQPTLWPASFVSARLKRPPRDC